MKCSQQRKFGRREVLRTAGGAAALLGLLGPGALAAQQAPANRAAARRKIKIAYIGGGSQTWGPKIIRDIVCKPGLQNVEMDIYLLEIHQGRALAMHELFKTKFKEWSVSDRVRTHPTLDPVEGLSGADLVLITIATGRLPAMTHDLAIPEKYGIFHTVGDTSGPGGWARGLRNFPVFEAYAKQIKELAPNAFVLNYSNPLAALTKVLANELGPQRVVGLCHGLFECYDVLMKLFGLASEDSLKIRFGGVNHFFWLLDFKVDGRDGYPLLEEKLKGSRAEGLHEASGDPLGFVSHKLLTLELFRNYHLLPYVGDRHTCEFFGGYITNKQTMERYRLDRTTIAHREAMYADAAKNIQKWTESPGGLTNKPSRETAADMIKAILDNEPYTDVVNVVNQGQLPNLPLGAVVETLGQVDARGFVPHTVGPLPARVRAAVEPHAQVQLRLVEAYRNGDVDEAMLTLAADPVCACLPVGEVRRMGVELLEAHRQFLPLALRQA